MQVAGIPVVEMAAAAVMLDQKPVLIDIFDLIPYKTIFIRLSHGIFEQIKTYEKVCLVSFTQYFGQNHLIKIFFSIKSIYKWFVTNCKREVYKFNMA